MRKYDYDYKEDIHQKNNKKEKQINHDHSDTVMFNLKLSEKLTYHVDIFYFYVTVNNYACCIYKTIFSSNNKLHQHVCSMHSKFFLKKMT